MKHPVNIVEELQQEVYKKTGSLLFERNSMTHFIAIFLVTAMQINSCNSKEIIKASGLSFGTVWSIKYRLKSNGIMTGNKLKYNLELSNWHDKKLGWMNFLLDCMSGEGLIIKRSTMFK